MNINYWNHIESMAVVDGTQQIFPKNILSLFDFLNLRPDNYSYIYIYHQQHQLASAQDDAPPTIWNVTDQIQNSTTIVVPDFLDHNLR